MMSQIFVKAEAVLNAKPEDVYTAIADYRNGHPYIVPDAFYDLHPVEGGYGAGTKIRFKMKVMGVEKSFYQQVSEPEPGRVLVEQDIDSVNATATTFTVTPVENGQKAHVKITTSMKPTPGFQGLVERLMVPWYNPRLYRKELKKLEAFAQKRLARAAIEQNKV
ncbi:MAG TPA: SRPBCC family protein [Ktedonobacteraceae bacterium]|nr:SRPBCC family protein [Ktedonobacteraceae bacterium]